MTCSTFPSHCPSALSRRDRDVRINMQERRESRACSSLMPKTLTQELATHVAPTATIDVLRLHDIAFADAVALLARHGLQLEMVVGDIPIPGSYWGEPEAGVIGSSVYVRLDTPVHSLLHEACHLIVLSPERRATVHTDASDCDLEEDATCYLQIVLADALPGVGRARLMADMDAWGYSFRLGSTHAWFERDADDVRTWLDVRGLLPKTP